MIPKIIPVFFMEEVLLKCFCPPPVASLRIHHFTPLYFHLYYIESINNLQGNFSILWS